MANSITNGMKRGMKIKNTVFDQDDSLTREEMNQEIRDFIYKHLGVKITKHNAEYYLSRFENMRSLI